MPFASVVDKLAPKLTDAGIKIVIADHPEAWELLQQRGSLIEVASTVASLEDHEVAYLQAMPRALGEAVRAVIVTAVEDEKSVHLQYSPAYEFGLSVWDYGRGISIHLAGPYPSGFERPGFEPPQS